MLTSLITVVLTFGSPSDFDAPATVGGGNNVHFTGSPTERWTCAVCHDAEVTGPNPVTFTATGRDLVTQGYVPGETYELELATTGEGRAAFALEFANRTGARAGTLELAPPLMGNAGDQYLCSGVDPVVLTANGGVAQSYACAVKKWRLTWRAPASDEGSVTLYASVVDSNADSRTTGDFTHSLVLGIPSPSTIGAKTSGCSAAPGLMLMVALVLIIRRRRAGVMLAAVLLISSGAEAAKKKKVAPKKPAVEAPVRSPEPVPAPEPTPAPVSAPSPQPSPVGEREKEVAVPEPVVVATIPDTSSVPGGLEAEARLGFGFRSLALNSASYATPFHASFGFPSVWLGLTMYPTRLMRSSVLTGLHVQGSYAVGVVLQTLPLGGALVMPSEARVALGYTVRAGPLELSPRALYRVVIGGVERNALFDDGFFQSVGGELALGLVVGSFSVNVTPRAGVVVDVGTQMERGYGEFVSGTMFGGSAGAGWRFSPFFQLSATYQLTYTRNQFAGRGERDFEAMTMTDVVHAGYAVLVFEY